MYDEFILFSESNIIINIMKAVSKKSEGKNLIAIIGDEVSPL